MTVEKASSSEPTGALADCMLREQRLTLALAHPCGLLAQRSWPAPSTSQRRV